MNQGKIDAILERADSPVVATDAVRIMFSQEEGRSGRTIERLEPRVAVFSAQSLFHNPPILAEDEDLAT
jgi:hypothetical protein